MISREEYMEVIDFMITSGGSYSMLDSNTCDDIIVAMNSGRYRVTRNDSGGAIKSFTSWWFIHIDDLEIVKQGNRPADISTGSIVYIADHCGVGSYPSLIRFLRNDKMSVGKRGVCWHSRYKQPDTFIYMPNKEGYHNV